MSILVIGGAGFIGRRLIPLLVAENKAVTCMDVDVSGAKAAFAAYSDKVKVIRGDVTAFDDVIGAMIDSKAKTCLLYTSPSPRDGLLSRMPSSA